MRVLFFGPYPLPGQPITGGVMAVVHALVGGLAVRPGFTVGVASVHPDITPRVEREGPLTIYRVPVPRFRRWRWQRPLRRALVQTAQLFEPTLIHAHGTGYAASAALDSGRPNVITVHGVVRYEAMLSGARGLKERLAWQYDALFENLVLRRARHCIAISPYIRRAFARCRNILWSDIENPVDNACFTIARRPVPGYLLCPARVIPRKGIDILIRAFARCAEAHPHAHLYIAGETDSNPNYVAQCRVLAHQAGLDERITFLGNLQRQALLEALGKAECVVLPARQETAPVAIAEALAAGCPVVATTVGGVPDMVSHGDTGLLAPPEDPDALASALARILESPTRAMSARARAQAERYRLAVVLDKTLRVYDKVLAHELSHPVRR